MKPSFLEGALLAGIMSVAGSMLYRVLAPLYGSAPVLHGVCAAIGLGYVLYLLARSRVRNGRVTLLAGWTLGALAIAACSPSLLFTVCAHLALVWLVRVLSFHASVLTALADLALSAASLVAAVWALLQTDSLFASLWCLWLVQAAFTLLPAQFGGAARCASPSESDPDARFERAARAAEAALRALSVPR